MLNVYSSISVDAIKYNVPVISLNKFVNWDKAILKTKKVGPNATMGLRELELSLEILMK